ncbi:MAG: SUMF1/EgtB/PvdO family nonheme iron enzyme [Persicimonas sp.]
MKLQRLVRYTLTGMAAASLLGAAATAGAQEKAPNAPEVDLSEMVELDGGEFTMGTSTDEEVGRYGDSWWVNEQPAHPVEVDGFHLDTHEVSVEEFALFLSYAGGDHHWRAVQPIEKVADGYLPVDGHAAEPIRSVSWQAADHYCKWAGKRLPTEAEWEYAAAGPDGREFPWGDEGAGCEAANYFAGTSFCQEGAIAVGSHPDGATPDGVRDMAGNVAEWVADWYGRYPDDAPSLANPTGPEAGELKVVRGGGHLSSGRWRRTRARFGADPTRGSRNIGFRCAYDSPSDDGALRGELAAPADEDRQQRDHPRVPAAQTPAVVTEGLSRPGSVVAAQGEWFVLERAGGSIVGIDPDDWSTRLVVESLDQPVDMATDGALLYVTDRGSQSLLSVDPASGEVTTLAADQPVPRRLDADGSGLAWFSESTLNYYDFDTEEVRELAADIAGPVSLHLAGSTVFYATDGDGDPAQTTLSTVDITGAAEPNGLLDEATFGEALNPIHMVIGDSGRYLWFVMGYRSFPKNGFACRIDLEEGSGSCPTHTPPPVQTRMAVVEDTVYLPIRNSVITYEWDQDRIVHELTPWTRAGGLLVGDGFVVWTDERNGRVYYEPRN